MRVIKGKQNHMVSFSVEINLVRSSVLEDEPGLSASRVRTSVSEDEPRFRRFNVQYSEGSES